MQKTNQFLAVEGLQISPIPVEGFGYRKVVCEDRTEEHDYLSLNWNFDTFEQL